LRFDLEAREEFQNEVGINVSAREKGAKRAHPRSLSERTVPEPGINKLREVAPLASCWFFVEENLSPIGS
jgi:hypothetical protein